MGIEYIYDLLLSENNKITSLTFRGTMKEDETTIYSKLYIYISNFLFLGHSFPAIYDVLLIAVTLIVKCALNVIQLSYSFKILYVLNLLNAIMVFLIFDLILLVAVYKAISGTVNECADVCPGNCKKIFC